MPSSRFLAGALVIVSGLWVSAVKGNLITFDFAGHITRLDGDVGFLGGTIPVGTPFSGSYTFDSSTPDLSPAEPRLGRYDGAITALSLLVGPYELFGVQSPLNTIRVTNDLSGYDSYSAGDETTPLVGRPVEIGMIFGDAQANAFVDDSLPISPFSLEPFEDRIMQMSSSSSQFFIVCELSLLAPEPSALLLMGLGLWPFLPFRRRANQSQNLRVRIQ